jgi:hypothetical protein
LGETAHAASGNAIDSSISFRNQFIARPFSSKVYFRRRSFTRYDLNAAGPGRKERLPEAQNQRDNPAH